MDIQQDSDGETTMKDGNLTMLNIAQCQTFLFVGRVRAVWQGPLGISLSPDKDEKPLFGPVSFL